MLREAVGRPVTSAEHNSSISLSPSNCLNAEGARALQDRNVRISFISHSLGSRMLFDVIGADDSNTKAPTESLVAFERATDTFFMAANQLALLGIASGVKPVAAQAPGLSDDEQMIRGNIQQDCPGSEPSFLTVRCRTESVAVTKATQLTFQKECSAALSPSETAKCRERVADATRRKMRSNPPEGRTLWVVGFFDPGDLLGYSLMGGRTSKDREDIRFISVLHRNTPQILRLGSNPLVAHDNELALESLARPGAGHPRSHHAPPYPSDRPTEVFKSPNAMAMIFCGASSDPQGRLTPGKCLLR